MSNSPQPPVTGDIVRDIAREFGYVTKGQAKMLGYAVDLVIQGYNIEIAVKKIKEECGDE